jgi:GcrA cell cycle regulator
MRTTKNWTREDAERVRIGWERGETEKEIAVAVGRQPRTVYKKARRMGLKRRGFINPRKYVWTAEKDAQLYEFRAEGHKVEVIAKKMGMTHSAVASRIVKLKVPFTLTARPETAPPGTKFGWTNENVETLKQLWAEGHSKGQIGRMLGISRNSVTGKVMRLNLPSRAPKIEDKPAPRKIAPRVYKAPEKPRYIPRFFRPTSGEPCCFATETGSEVIGKRYLYCDAPATLGPYCAEHAAGLYVERKSNRSVAA